ncbi:hypothetical protein ElyMa_003640700 [Elysia marginata]|uniref:Ig-like domain-containing protein n=1 Tax=Elysia marginata TaxID=1093978 RepID=A0AAV4EWS5_9GAST|nr:hypothetical protein ElyMa_003640700 [Elysia marginata]
MFQFAKILEGRVSFVLAASLHLLLFCQAANTVGTNSLTTADSNEEDVFISMDRLIAVVNVEYWVRATIKMSKQAGMVYAQDITFEGLNKKCKITSEWKFCTPDNKKPEKFSCGCSSRKVLGDIIYYRFYFFIGVVKPEIRGEKFQAFLGPEDETICFSSHSIRIVQFKSTPQKSEDGNLKICSGVKTRLPWIYEGSQEIGQRFQVSSIEWKNKDDALAQLRYDKNRREIFDVKEQYKDKVTIEQDVDTSFFMITLLKPISNNKTTVKIIVRFNETKYINAKKNDEKMLRWKRGRLKMDFVGGVKNHANNARNLIKRSVAGLSSYNNITPSINMTISASTSPASIPSSRIIATTPPPTTIVTTTTTTTTSTKVPELDYRTEEDLFQQLEDEIEIFPLTPPSPYVEATIFLRYTIAGAVLVLCSVPKGSLGHPPVNLSIWQTSEDGRRELLATQQASTNLRYLPLYTEGVYFSCGLEGHALDCLAKDEPPRKIARSNSTGLLHDTEDHGIDWFLVLYGVETFSALSIMLWTISNFIQHIRLILWREKMILAERAKIVEYN